MASKWKAFGETYLILLGANYISNALIHPTAKIDYGIMNRLYLDGREVNSFFWGTRLPHLFIIPASLTVYDKLVGHIFTTRLGMISFQATPSLALAHLFVYTWCAVGSFITFDAAFNPQHEGKRKEQVISSLRPLTVGMSLQWHADLMKQMIGSAKSGPVAILRNATAISLVFFPVKSLGFGDVGEAGLSPHERKMNGLPPTK
mmetsp:Transcript_18772/g.31632  ORF Transcript_18772/g.31632 Transcript_18772/m.31632 type:complete len:203 (-) Transcript_18772:3441-4049(-)